MRPADMIKALRRYEAYLVPMATVLSVSCYWDLLYDRIMDNGTVWGSPTLPKPWQRRAMKWDSLGLTDAAEAVAASGDVPPRL